MYVQNPKKCEGGYNPHLRVRISHNVLLGAELSALEHMGKTIARSKNSTLRNSWLRLRSLLQINSAAVDLPQQDQMFPGQMNPQYPQQSIPA